MSKPTQNTAPLTAAQMGLLYESLTQTHNALNLLQVEVEFTQGNIDQALMIRAWEIIAQRHDALRLQLDPLAKTGPVQRLIESPALDIACESLSANGVQHWLEADLNAGISIGQGLAWRVRLLSHGAACHHMVWTFHHALLDGNGYRLILCDLLACYDALCAGEGMPFGPPAPSFLAYCAAIDKLPIEDGLAFFRAHLHALQGTNKIALAQQSDQSVPVPRLVDQQHLGKALSDDIRALARRMNVTTSAVFNAAWAVLLARLSNQTDAVFGVTRSGRYSTPEAAKTAGCLINTLPCRLRLKDVTLADVLQQAGAYIRQIKAFEHLPYHAILDACEVESGSALFDSFVLFDRASPGRQPKLRAALGQGRRLNARSMMAAPFSLAVYDEADIVVRLEYSPDVVAPEWGGRLIAYLKKVLKQFAQVPVQTPIAQISMLPEDEEEKLLALGQMKQTEPLPTNQLDLLGQFEALVAELGQNQAVAQIGCDAVWSFAQLEARAHQIAQALYARGVARGDIVALALPRAPDYVAAILATWKVGAAFLPLDPSYAPDALQYMITQSKAALILAPCAADAARIGSDVDVLSLDQLDQGNGAKTLPPAPADPQRLAYVIFTSGSSGRPKGVGVSHSALAHHAASIRQAFALSPDDRVLQFTSLNFDVSIEEIIPTLLSGATVVLRNEAVLTNMSDFLAALASHRITVANLPTAFWHVLVDATDQLADSLRLLIVGGEKVSEQHMQRWRTRFAHLRVLNGYGPTETTITASLFDTADWNDQSATLPIGRPLAHCSAYLACADGSPAPFGLSGELWLGGAAVAQGYLHRPDLTDTAFVPSAWPKMSGRMYRTGDKAQWDKDGNLVFLGRMDRQIKLRGYRLELAALEAAMVGHPDISAAIAALDHAGTDRARLLIWVQPAAGRNVPDDTQLRTCLSDVLPPAVTASFIPIFELPQTPGGKVDIARLPRPDPVSDTQDVTDTAPSDALTQMVQHAFAAVLGGGPVGPDQSFFDLGGHSLLALRLGAEIEKLAGTRIDMRHLLKAPTPRQLAAVLNTAHGPSQTDCIFDIQPDGDEAALYAVQILGPEFSFFRPLAHHLGKTQPVFGVMADILDPDTPRDIRALAEIFAAAIMAHRPGQPVKLIGVSQGAFFAVELAQQLYAQGVQVEAVYLLDAAGPDGRVKRLLHKDWRYYAGRLLRNPWGVIHGRAQHILSILRFAMERRRLQRRGVRRDQAVAGKLSVTTQMAAIDLMVRDYQPRHYPGTLSLVRASNNFADTGETIRDALGWRRWAQKVHMLEVDGGHLTMLEEPYVQQLAQKLKALDRDDA